MANVKINLVALNNATQTFGNTDYAVFDAETADKQPLVLAITHNALIRANVKPELLDSLVGSSVIVKDDTDIRTGELVTAEERIGRVVNQEINPNTGKPYQIVLVNSANCSVVKSELYLAEMKDLASSTNAKMLIEEKKERKLLALKRASERLRNAVGAVKPTETVEAEKVEEELEF